MEDDLKSLRIDRSKKRSGEPFPGLCAGSSSGSFSLLFSERPGQLRQTETPLPKLMWCAYISPGCRGQW